MIHISDIVRADDCISCERQCMHYEYRIRFNICWWFIKWHLKQSISSLMTYHRYYYWRTSLYWVELHIAQWTPKLKLVQVANWTGIPVNIQSVHVAQLTLNLVNIKRLQIAQWTLNIINIKQKHVSAWSHNIVKTTL